jgi:hypothetical protein
LLSAMYRQLPLNSPRTPVQGIRVWIRVSV